MVGLIRSSFCGKCDRFRSCGSMASGHSVESVRCLSSMMLPMQPYMRRDLLWLAADARKMARHGDLEDHGRRVVELGDEGKSWGWEGWQWSAPIATTLPQSPRPSHALHRSSIALRKVPHGLVHAMIHVERLGPMPLRTTNKPLTHNHLIHLIPSHTIVQSTSRRTDHALHDRASSPNVQSREAKAQR